MSIEKLATNLRAASDEWTRADDAWRIKAVEIRRLDKELDELRDRAKQLFSKLDDARIALLRETEGERFDGRSQMAIPMRKKPDVLEVLGRFYGTYVVLTAEEVHTVRECLKERGQ